MCGKQDLSTYFDYQFHFRKAHNVCEICMVSTESQDDLHRHCQVRNIRLLWSINRLSRIYSIDGMILLFWQGHFEELMCMKCFLTYDDALGFSKHLFNKHEDEHKVCKTCHDKTWPHVFHWCGFTTTGRDSHVCEVCEERFVDFRKYRWD